jgi:hypothetical protein
MLPTIEVAGAQANWKVPSLTFPAISDSSAVKLMPLAVK